MDETDAFFTRTIVGAPCSVMLGRRATASPTAQLGLDIGLRDGDTRLSRAWNDYLLLGRADDWRGRPRRRPGVLTRWLERHALVIAAGGLMALVIAALVLARAWSWN
jgi:hypothetical protein